MHKVYIAIVLLLIVIGKTTAQEPEQEKHYRIGASLGYSFAGYREETYSPINKYLNNLTFIIDGNIEKGDFFHSLNIGFFMGNAEMADGEKAILRESYDPVKGEAYSYADIQEYQYIRGYLEYALDYRLWGNGTFPGYLGGAFRADTYMQFAHYPSITALLSLDVHASQKWIINSENDLILSISFPLFGYAVRPAYAGADYALIKYSEMVYFGSSYTRSHNPRRRNNKRRIFPVVGTLFDKRLDILGIGSKSNRYGRKVL
jgi:hypothetical protein